MNKIVAILVVLCISSFAIPCLADCPTADLSGDCKVDFADFAALANQWLTGPLPPSDVNMMVIIPGGTFQMGDSKGEGNSDELPAHTVTMSCFYIGKYDVTNQQYCSFLNSVAVKVVGGIVYASTDASNDYPYCDTSAAGTYSQIAYNDGVFSVSTKGGRSMVNDPMVCVSWYGAVAYCNWRSQQEGKAPCYDLSTWVCDFTKSGYHLPTEAQWEYSARGGLSDKRFPWGDTITHVKANYYSTSSYSYDLGGPPWGYDQTWSSDGINPYTSPVGSFAANGYGLYDMAGNVWQLCNDWYSSSYYSSSSVNNPTGPASGSNPVFRGSPWSGGTAYYCRVSHRGANELYYRGSGVGFRVALDLN